MNKDEVYDRASDLLSQIIGDEVGKLRIGELLFLITMTRDCSGYPQVVAAFDGEDLKRLERIVERVKSR